MNLYSASPLSGQRIFFIVLLLGVFSHQSASATSYFVDAASGNDQHPGTSPQAAWKSFDPVHDKMYSWDPFAAGDAILFKRGQSWRGRRLAIEEVHGTAANPVIFGAYGEGANPVLSVITPHTLSWSFKGNNIWKAENSPGYHPERLFRDGTELLRANIYEELGPTFVWLYQRAGSVSELYLHSPDDPGNALIEYSAVNPSDSQASLSPLIISNTSHILLQDLDIQGGWTGIHIAEGVSNIRLHNLDVGKFSSNGINIYAGENIVIDDCDFNSHFALDYSMAGVYRESFERGTGDGIVIYGLTGGEINNSRLTNWGHASINLDGGPTMQVTGVSIFGNRLTSPDICYGGRLAVDDAHHCEIFNNQIINTSVQSQLNGHSNHYHHNIFLGTRNSPLNDINDEIDAGVDVSDYSHAEVRGNIYENNLVANTEGVGIRLSGNNLKPVHDNIFRNNVVYNCGLLQLPGIHGIGIKIALNEDQDIPTYSNHFQTNLAYNEATENTYSFRGTVTNAEGFNQYNGTDDFDIIENIGKNPRLKDLENGDYRLQNDSPCRDAGTHTLATFDYYGNPVPFGIRPDIGIHELSRTTKILLFMPAFLHQQVKE